MGKMKDRYTTNPFMGQFGAAITQKTYRRPTLIDADYVDAKTGESVRTYLSDTLRKSYDGRPFIKLITTDESMDILNNLSSASYKLFLWILKHIEYGSDWIIIYGARTQVELGYKSINSMYKAIDGLLESKIIAPKDGGAWIFYINPTVFYYGDIVPAYIAHVAQENLSLQGFPDMNINATFEAVVFDKQIPEEVKYREMKVPDEDKTEISRQFTGKSETPVISIDIPKEKEVEDF